MTLLDAIDLDTHTEITQTQADRIAGILDDQHHAVTIDINTDYPAWQATCPCGWYSDPTNWRQQAEDDGSDHGTITPDPHP